MVVCYQFKNETTWHQINVVERHIQLFEVKEKILTRHKIIGGNNLLIQNAMTGESYTEDKTYLDSSISLFVRRIPKKALANALMHYDDSIKTSDKNVIKNASEISVTGNNNCLGNSFDDSFEDSIEKSVQDLEKNASPKNPNKIPIEKTEVEKLNDLMQHSSSYLNPSNSHPSNSFHSNAYPSNSYPSNPKNKPIFQRSTNPAPNYVCHRCAKKGHFIQHCPTNGDPDFDIKIFKNPTGIPKMFLQKNVVEEQNEEQEVYQTKDKQQFVVNNKKRSLHIKHEDSILPNKKPTFKAFTCPICLSELKNAVFVLCCFTSFCEECIKQHLVDSEECFVCENFVSVQNIQENFALRAIVSKQRFIN